MATMGIFGVAWVPPTRWMTVAWLFLSRSIASLLLVKMTGCQ